MRLPYWSDNDHGTLVLLELGGVLVAILATFFTLALAEIGFVAVRSAITAVGGGDAAVTTGRVVIALGTLLGLIAGGGYLVVGYRRYFETQFTSVSPLPVVAVPLLGIVAPIGYARWNGGSPLLTSWLFFPTAIATYALAYRTIAIDAIRADHGRTSFVAGALTALPVVVALVELARQLLDPEYPIARTLETIVSATGVPMERSIVLAVPLLVTARYGVLALYRKQSVWDGPGWDWSWDRNRDRVRNGTSSMARIGNRLRAGLARVRTTSFSFARRLAGKGFGGVSSNVLRSTDGSATASTANRKRTGSGKSVVPSSPGSTTTAGSRSNDRDDSTGAENGAATTGADADRTGDETADETEKSIRSTTDRRGDDGSDDSPSEPSEAADSTADADADADSETGVGSDTRIFVDDFDQYVPEEPSGETPVETCPQCDDEIPSDGVYNFCPFCGAEL